MTDTEADFELRTVHDQLLDLLDRLDRAREHGAAAHVLAAIDLLESRIDPDSRFRRRGDDDGAIATIARAMLAGFGPRAHVVARRQLENATGSTFLAWAAIINRMEGQGPVASSA